MHDGGIFKNKHWKVAFNNVRVAFPRTNTNGMLLYRREAFIRTNSRNLPLHNGGFTRTNTWKTALA